MRFRTSILFIVLCFIIYHFHFIWNSNYDGNSDCVTGPLKVVHVRGISSLPPESISSASTSIQVTRDIYELGFSINGSSICPENGKDISILIFVTSAPSHFSHREAIRLTWGQLVKGKGMSLAFLLGSTLSSTIAEKIENENVRTHDIIKANSIDSYYNLTLKTLSLFEWVNTFCNQSEIVLKTDDAVYINIPILLKFINRLKMSEKKVAEPTIYGCLAKRFKPIRDNSSKYYISMDKFSRDIYPDFTRGPAYVFTPFISQSVFTKAMNKPYFHLEDVFLTGIVAEEVKIKRVGALEFGREQLRLSNTKICRLLKLIYIHGVSYLQQFELWRRYPENGSTKCNNNTTLRFTKSKYNHAIIPQFGKVHLPWLLFQQR